MHFQIVFKSSAYSTITYIFLFPHIDPDESCMELERKPGDGITGFCTSVDGELKVLHDVFSAVLQPGAQKAS